LDCHWALPQQQQTSITARNEQQRRRVLPNGKVAVAAGLTIPLVYKRGTVRPFQRTWTFTGNLNTGLYFAHPERCCPTEGAGGQAYLAPAGVPRARTVRYRGWDLSDPTLQPQSLPRHHAGIGTAASADRRLASRGYPSNSGGNFQYASTNYHRSPTARIDKTARSASPGGSTAGCVPDYLLVVTRTLSFTSASVQYLFPCPRSRPFCVSTDLLPYSNLAFPQRKSIHLMWCCLLASSAAESQHPSPATVCP